MYKEQIKHVGHESEVPQFKKTIGILGGMGQWATQDITRRILEFSATHVPQYGNRGYPEIISQMINRSNLQLYPDGKVIEPVKPAPELLEMAKFIGANADILIMPSNTPHLFIKEVEEAAGKPLLSIVDVTMAEVARRKKEVAVTRPGKRTYNRVGVLAIGPTLNAGLYQNPLKAMSIESVTIPKSLSEKLDLAIYNIQEGEDPKSVSSVGYEAFVYLNQKKVDGIIMGCTEIPLMFDFDDFKTINPSQLLAEAAVKAALA